MRDFKEERSVCIVIVWLAQRCSGHVASQVSTHFDFSPARITCSQVPYLRQVTHYGHHPAWTCGLSFVVAALTLFLSRNFLARGLYPRTKWMTMAYSRPDCAMSDVLLVHLLLLLLLPLSLLLLLLQILYMCLQLRHCHHRQISH